MPSGAGKRGLQQRSLPQDHLIQRLGAAGVADQRRVRAEQEQAKRGAGHVAVHEEVDRARGLVVGRRGVEHEAVVGGAGEGEADAERAVAVAIGIDAVGEAVRARCEDLPQPAADEGFGAGQQLAQRVGEDGGAEAGDDLRHTTDAQQHAGHERAGVAPALRGVAGVAVEDLQRRLVHHALGDQAGRRDHDAFLEDVGRVGADRSGAQAADIGEVRPAHDEGAQCAAVEDGGEEHLVVAVGHCAARAVAVTEPVKIARPHGFGRETLQHRRRHVTEDGHVGADGELPGRIEQGGVEILLLADEGADGGAFQQRLHLRLCRPDRAAHDLQRDGVADALAGRHGVRARFRPGGGSAPRGPGRGRAGSAPPCIPRPCGPCRRRRPGRRAWACPGPR